MQRCFYRDVVGLSAVIAAEKYVVQAVKGLLKYFC
jgi:hypothetical protein